MVRFIKLIFKRKDEVDYMCNKYGRLWWDNHTFFNRTVIKNQIKEFQKLKVGDIIPL